MLLSHWARPHSVTRHGKSPTIGGMTTASHTTDVLSPELLAAIAREAKAQRRSPERMVRQLLEDAADYREAERVAKRIASGQEKTTDAQTVYKRLGLI